MGWIVIFATASLVLAACGKGASGTSQGSGTSSTPGTFTIGYTGTLSGEFASYALQMEQGVALAVAEINKSGGIDGQQVRVITADDQGQPSNGPVIARRFCSNPNVQVVLGYSFSSVAVAAVPVYNQCHLPVVASAVTSPLLSGSSPYFFRDVLTDNIQGADMGKYAVDVLGFKRIATLYQVDDYGQGVNTAFVSAVKAAGGQVVAQDGYQLGSTAFQTQLTQIKGLHPDAIFVGGFYPEAAKIAQQARALGMTQQILGTDGSLSPQLVTLGGSAVEGMIIYGMFDPATATSSVAKSFVSAFKAKYGQDPSSWAALAYDAVYAVKSAAQQSGGTSRGDIQTGLTKIDFQGVTGQVGFDSKGDRTGLDQYLVVKNGQFMLAPKQLGSS